MVQSQEKSSNMLQLTLMLLSLEHAQFTPPGDVSQHIECADNRLLHWNIHILNCATHWWGGGERGEGQLRVAAHSLLKNAQGDG